jgi:hypothetical protein
MSHTIPIDRNASADAVAIVRLLRTKRHGDAMSIIGSYEDSVPDLEALCGSVAGLANALLTTIDSMADQLNRDMDRQVPGADAVLAKAAEALA